MSAVALLRADLANLRRDPMLLGASLAIVPLTLALRFGWPQAVVRLAPWVDLAPYGGLVALCAGLLAPLLMGTVVGFMMLEERDEGVDEAFAVSPMRLRGWLAWRLAAPVGLGFIAFIVILTGSRLETPSWPATLAAATLAALEVPLFGTLLVSLARNKVEGLALSKALNLLVMVPVAFALWASPLRWALALVPTVWPVAIGLGQAPTWSVLVGLAAHAAWLGWAIRRL